MREALRTLFSVERLQRSGGYSGDPATRGGTGGEIGGRRRAGRAIATIDDLGRPVLTPEGRAESTGLNVSSAALALDSVAGLTRARSRRVLARRSQGPKGFLAGLQDGLSCMSRMWEPTESFAADIVAPSTGLEGDWLAVGSDLLRARGHLPTSEVAGAERVSGGVPRGFVRE